MAALTATILAGAALATTAVGTITQMGAAKDAAEAQKSQIEHEQQLEAERQKAMELDARRKTLETIRTAQRTRALALNAATSQGAGLGSGLQGGYGQVAGQFGTNYLGIQQNLEIGRNTFDINALISQDKIALAEAQSNAAFGAGLTSLGGSLMNSLGAINRLSGGVSFSGFGNTQPTSSYNNMYGFNPWNRY